MSQIRLIIPDKREDVNTHLILQEIQEPTEVKTTLEVIELPSEYLEITISGDHAEPLGVIYIETEDLIRAVKAIEQKRGPLGSYTHTIR